MANFESIGRQFYTERRCFLACTPLSLVPPQSLRVWARMTKVYQTRHKPVVELLL